MRRGVHRFRLRNEPQPKSWDLRQSIWENPQRNSKNKTRFRAGTGTSVWCCHDKRKRPCYFPRKWESSRAKAMWVKARLLSGFDHLRSMFSESWFAGKDSGGPTGIVLIQKIWPFKHNRPEEVLYIIFVAIHTVNPEIPVVSPIINLLEAEWFLAHVETPRPANQALVAGQSQMLFI